MRLIDALKAEITSNSEVIDRSGPEFIARVKLTTHRSFDSIKHIVQSLKICVDDNPINVFT